MIRPSAIAKTAPAIARAEAAVKSIPTNDTAAHAELLAIQDAVAGFGFLVDQDVVLDLEDRARHLESAARAVAAVIRERDTARASLERLQSVLSQCGEMLRAALGRQLQDWSRLLSTAGSDVVRPDDAENDRHRVQNTRSQIDDFVTICEALAKARGVVRDLRVREGGVLPLVAVHLDQLIPEVERQIRPGCDVDGLRRELNAALVEPTHDLHNPPQPPEALTNARLFYDQLTQWHERLEDNRARRMILQDLEGELHDLEADWRAQDPYGAEGLVARVKSHLQEAEAQGQRLRAARWEALRRDAVIIQGAGLSFTQADTGLADLARTTECPPEIHARWLADVDATRQKLIKAIMSKVATGDLDRYVRGIVTEAEHVVASFKITGLAASVERILNDLTRSHKAALGVHNSAEEWLDALRIVAGTEAQLSAAKAEQAARLAEYQAQVASVTMDVECLRALEAMVSIPSGPCEVNFDDFHPKPGDPNLDEATRRVASTEARVRTSAAQVAMLLGEVFQQQSAKLLELSGHVARLGGQVDDRAVDPPEDWRAWPTILGDVVGRVAKSETSVVDLCRSRQAEGLQISHQLARARGATMRIEDFERTKFLVADLDRVCNEGNPDFIELVDVLSEARSLLEELTEASRGLERLHGELLGRLKALGTDGFRDIYRELEHRVSALIKGFPLPPQVPWSELEGQLRQADALLLRLEAEGRRFAAAEVRQWEQVLERDPNAAERALLERLKANDPMTLPPRSLRSEIREVCRRRR